MPNARKLAAPVTLLALLASATSSAAPSGSPGAAPTPTLTARPPIKMAKMATQLAVKNVAALPGETKSFEATLTDVKGAAVPGAPVSFRIQGGGKIIAVGAGSTNTAGKVAVSYKLPELAQGSYTLVAHYAGGETTLGVDGDAKLAMFKTITKLELGDLIWGTYKNEPGPPYGVIGVRLSRTTDNQGLEKNIQITVNGNTWTLYGSAGAYHQIPLPSSATTWNVSVQYEGDAANAPTAAQRTYHKP